jgi:hypothetical protein
MMSVPIATCTVMELEAAAAEGHWRRERRGGLEIPTHHLAKTEPLRDLV